MKVVHRDIKPSNVVLTKDWTAQVTDFGISRLTDIDRTMTKNIGSADYMAPEMLDGHDNSQGNDALPVEPSIQSRLRAAVDVYAFGILIAVLFNRKSPYESIPTAAVWYVDLLRRLLVLADIVICDVVCFSVDIATVSYIATAVQICQSLCQLASTACSSPCGLQIHRSAPRRRPC